MKYTIAVSAIFLLVLAGCATPLTPRESGTDSPLLCDFMVEECAAPLTPRESGTLTGAEIGAATGAMFGGIAGAPGRGVAIGAAVGAVIGALTGNAIQSEQADRAYASRYAYASQPYQQPSGTLQIEVTPEDAGIFVDGRRIGLAKEFRGSSVVPVVAGFHLVEFHWRRFSVANHIVVPPQTTVPIRRDLAVSAPALLP
jgi:Glycine zipper